MTERPDYGETLEAHMIADYVSGGMTLVDACRTLSIPYSTVADRIRANPGFAEMMEVARTAGYDVIANECLAIADDGTNDFMEREDRFGNLKIMLDKEHIQRSKLRVDTRLKLLAKWHPKQYGDKLQIESKTASVAVPVGDDPVAAQRAYEALLAGKG